MTCNLLRNSGRPQKMHNEKEVHGKGLGRLIGTLSLSGLVSTKFAGPSRLSFVDGQGPVVKGLVL